MSDNQGVEPHESTAAAASAPQAAPATSDASTTPASEAGHAQASQPAAPPVPPAPQSWQPPAAPDQPAASHAASAAHQPPASAARPSGYAGYAPPQSQPYGAPQGQHGAPQPPQGQPYGAPGSQSGHPQGGYPAYATGNAFGPGASSSGHQPTQPTLPLGADGGNRGGGDDATSGMAAAGAAPRRKNGAPAVVGLIVAAALVGGAAGLGGAYAGVNLWGGSSSAPAAGPQTVTVNNTDSVNATTAIAAKVTPSVVTIQASSGSEGGTGSGVVLTEDGYIATNTHVVTLDGAASNATLRVTTSDGHVYDATIVGTDPTYDLAVIKLKDASGLTPIQFGDSSKLNVGDLTVAIGAPLGLSNTVTDGIVSALNRSIQIASSAAPDSSDTQGDSGQGNGEGSPFQFDIPGQGTQQQQPSKSISIAVIQTDAAINPGNSGGALVDSEGKLIGINVAIASAGSNSSGGQSGSIGVGFSIPSDIVKRVTDEIIANGQATHGLLGATVQPAESVQGATITGAYISEVTSGGAAASGGLKKGDIVTAFNGVPITNSIDLTAQVRAAAAGSKATVTYVRDGKTQTTDVTLGTLQQ